MTSIVVICMTLGFVILLSAGLWILPNKSNFPSLLMIPLITALITKYVLGDWDRGFQWSMTDIFYWVSIFSVSAGTVAALGV